MVIKNYIILSCLFVTHIFFGMQKISQKKPPISFTSKPIEYMCNKHNTFMVLTKNEELHAFNSQTKDRYLGPLAGYVDADLALNSNTIAAIKSDGTMDIINAQNGSIKKSIATEIIEISDDLVVEIDDKAQYILVSNNNIFKVVSFTGNVILEIQGHYSPELSPNGKYLISFDNSGNIYLWTFSETTKKFSKVQLDKADGSPLRSSSYECEFSPDSSIIFIVIDTIRSVMQTSMDPKKPATLIKRNFPHILKYNIKAQKIDDEYSAGGRIITIFDTANKSLLYQGSFSKPVKRPMYQSTTFLKTKGDHFKMGNNLKNAIFNFDGQYILVHGDNSWRLDSNAEKGYEIIESGKEKDFLENAEKIVGATFSADNVIFILLKRDNEYIFRRYSHEQLMTPATVQPTPVTEEQQKLMLKIIGHHNITNPDSWELGESRSYIKTYIFDLPKQESEYFFVRPKFEFTEQEIKENEKKVVDNLYKRHKKFLEGRKIFIDYDYVRNIKSQKMWRSTSNFQRLLLLPYVSTLPFRKRWEDLKYILGVD